MFNSEVIELFKQQETPFYHYDLGLLRQTLQRVKSLAEKYQFEIHYAVKANCNRTILKEVLRSGFGADCVSGNEVKLSIENGFSPKQILFAGVGKTDKEIRYALSKNIKSFNCESIQEIEVINELAKENNQITEIALRINPNVDAKTHKYITTGLDENKFGINQVDLPAVIEKLRSLENINLTGLHFHIGSQITDMNVFKGLCLRVNQISKWFADHGVNIEHLNLGGGLGINYSQPDTENIPDFETYFSVFGEFLERTENQKIHFELGRSIIGQCGNLISRVVYIKNGLNINFAILDAGMTELMRPALYQSYHQIDNLISNKEIAEYDVVGPICESTDCFGKSVKLAETQRGDLIAIRSAGAYGEVMISNYNLRDRNEAFYTE
jgi:diaminopimelate decarboxylase